MGFAWDAINLWMMATGMLFSFWLGWRLRPVGTKGRPRTDIERLHVEAELRASAARLRMMLETTAEGVLGIDDEARVMFANRAACAILGWSHSNEIVGRPATQVLGHRLGDGSVCCGEDCSIVMTLKDSQTRRVSDEFFKKASGRQVAVEYVSSPLVVEGITIGAVVAFHDITDRKRLMEELRRSNAELEQFAYVASHDLRQPLRMVSSYLALIKKRIDDRLGEEERQFITYAVDGAKRMDALILDLLDYSRIGRDPVYEAIALAEVIDDVSHNLSVALADSAGRLEVAEGLPVVDGNRLELMRLYQNLIGNALKYRHPERAPVVEVGWRDEGDEWVVWVADNGLGMEADDHARAFGIFQRLAHGRHVEGTGIGLAIAKKIVEHHGGRIWIESEMDQGTRMLVAFPKQRAAAMSVDSTLSRVVGD